MKCDLLEAHRVQSIVGGFFDVYNYYGYGLSERVYSGALDLELRDRGHSVARELAIDVWYKGRHVAGHRLDMVIDDRIIIEMKASKELLPIDRMQLVSYLRASAFEVGVLLHFGPIAKFERLIDHPKRKQPHS